MSVRVESVDDMTWRDALKVGLAQAFALIPGTSRSGATIIGGMLFGLSRKAATEFSFFLAVPTLIARRRLRPRAQPALCSSAADVGPFAVGFVASFVSAFFCVRWLLRYIATPRLHCLRLVPDRVRRRRAGHGLHGPGRLVARLSPAVALSRAAAAMAP